MTGDNEHPAWCDPLFCRVKPAEHPATGPPSHRSRMHFCDQTGRATESIAVQLIRLVELPDRDFLHIAIVTWDERHIYHVDPAQGWELVRVLPELLAAAEEARK